MPSGSGVDEAASVPDAVDSFADLAPFLPVAQEP